MEIISFLIIAISLSAARERGEEAPAGLRGEEACGEAADVAAIPRASGAAELQRRPDDRLRKGDAGPGDKSAAKRHSTRYEIAVGWGAFVFDGGLSVVHLELHRAPVLYAGRVRRVYGRLKPGANDPDADTGGDGQAEQSVHVPHAPGRVAPD